MKNYRKEILVTLYKAMVYFVILSVFIIFMSRINGALIYLSRTSVITVSAYVLIILMMMPVYGNFEIGQRKTKLVFNATLISVFFADVLGLFVIYIMGILQYPASLVFGKGLLFLLFAFIVQLFVVWYGAKWGNSFYFLLYKPSKTIIIDNDKIITDKVKHYIVSHKKQYELIDVIHNPKFEDLDLSGIKTIFSIGMNSEFDKKLTQYCYYCEIDFLYDSEIHDLFSGKNKTLVIDDILMIDFPKSKMSLTQVIMKRLIDIIGSLILLILASPIFLFIAFLIQFDDGGPIFYRQERLTKDGVIFKMIKFRSMKENSGNVPARKNDERITRVGHFVRKIRMDELPQFLNILKGDMSMVGPRPESIEIMEKIQKEVPEFVFRLKVKGGLTGYAQVFGKYNTPPDKKLLLDLKYIESFSILNDIKLIFQTIIVFFKSDSTEPFSDK